MDLIIIHSKPYSIYLTGTVSPQRPASKPDRLVPDSGANGETHRFGGQGALFRAGGKTLGFRV